MARDIEPSDGIARMTKIVLNELINIAEEGEQHMLAYFLGMARDECQAILSDRPSVGSQPHSLEGQYDDLLTDNWETKTNIH